MIQEKVTFSSSQKDVSPIALSNEPKNKHNIILMSHNHISLLLGLASMENGYASSYRQWIEASSRFVLTGHYFSYWNLLRGAHSITETWVRVIKKGQRKSVYLTPRGKAIVNGQIPIKIRGLGLFDVKKMSVINIEVRPTEVK